LGRICWHTRGATKWLLHVLAAHSFLHEFRPTSKRTTENDFTLSCEDFFLPWTLRKLKADEKSCFAFGIFLSAIHAKQF